MRRFIVSLFWLLSSSAALAAPVDEDAFKPLADKGLVSQLTGHLYNTKDKAGDKATGLITQAMDLLGVPYRRGGSSETSGFDCSGFVRHLYEKSVGQILPRRAEEQARSTDVIDRSDLQPGDLVFFNTMKRAFSHVGIYVGDGKFIHSPRAGKSVKIEDMRSAYWQNRFNGARRVPVEAESSKP
ncbi:C40 family peptidase [Limnohabitans planktonicus]|uniref:Glycoside hydrolase n=1 Tax=Limnohabitans planktonicus II-D5 TaxID=1293045 RepID=A0A2T7UH39_9BURK|nr:C40 family peptidase [Limnohabitans planktonicus]PVE44025.1 glycoside hydrolase [Limnohabitans planktonicus II-D5]|eukprot:gene22000-26957_t